MVAGISNVPVAFTGSSAGRLSSASSANTFPLSVMLRERRVVSPASIYTTGMMKDIKSEKVNDDTVYSFNINAESEDGITFVSSIVGPYENFGGNFADAEIKVNSFNGKTYVNSEGYYYKTELSCDILVKFTEGDITMKFNQTINASKIGADVKCEFPEFNIDEYERMEQSDLLGAFNGSNASSKTE